jgi:hypothetical protein
MFGDYLNVKRDSKLNNVFVRKAAWGIFLVLSLALIVATISIYFQ